MCHELKGCWQQATKFGRLTNSHRSTSATHHYAKKKAFNRRCSVTGRSIRAWETEVEHDGKRTWKGTLIRVACAKSLSILSCTCRPFQPSRLLAYLSGQLIQPWHHDNVRRWCAFKSRQNIESARRQYALMARPHARKKPLIISKIFCPTFITGLSSDIKTQSIGMCQDGTQKDREVPQCAWKPRVASATINTTPHIDHYLTTDCGIANDDVLREISLILSSCGPTKKIGKACIACARIL